MAKRAVCSAGKRGVVSMFLVLQSVFLAWSMFVHIGDHKAAAQSPQTPDEIFIDFDSPLPGMGWNTPEVSSNGVTHQWMSAQMATLNTFFPASSGAVVEFCILRSIPNAVDALKFQVNGRDVTLFRTNTASCPYWFSGHVSREALALDPAQTTLIFLTGAADVADNIAHNGDTRWISVDFDWLRMTSDDQVSIEFDHPNSGTNWYPPQVTAQGKTYQWTSDRTAALNVFSQTSSGAMIEFCVLQGVPNAVETLKLQANGQNIALFQTTTEACPYLFSGHISRDIMAPSPLQTTLTFMTDAADTGDNIAHNGDTRLLSLALDWVRMSTDQEVYVDFSRPNPGSNWHPPSVSPEGRTYQWMNGRLATLDVFSQTDTGANLEFCVMEAVPNAVETLKLQVNAQEVALSRSSSVTCPYWFSGHISQEILALSPAQTTLTFMTDAADTADNIVHNGDTRVLSVALDWLRMTSDHEVFIDFDHALSGTNWHPPEVSPDGMTYAWTSDRTATLDVPFQATNGAWIKFCIQDAMPNAVETLKFQVNGQDIPLSRTGNAACSFRFTGRIPQEALAVNPAQVTLTFMTDVVDTADHIVGNGDTRPLSLALDWLKLESVR